MDFSSHIPVKNRRLSRLLAPTMQLSGGHESEIYTARFSPNGFILASGGHDRKILLWNVYGECVNWASLLGHGGAIMQLEWRSDGTELVSCGTDRLAFFWDMGTCSRVKKCKGHRSYVNGVTYNPSNWSLVSTCSDDGTIRLWDKRRRAEIGNLTSSYQVLSIAYTSDGKDLCSGGIDEVVKVWDLRRMEQRLTLRGHTDTITGMAMSTECDFLATNAMDNTVRVWDVRSFVPEGQNRCLAVHTGHKHNFEKNLLRVAWSADGKRISAGSSDRILYVWSHEMAPSGSNLLYRLPGHSGSVNETHFHPIESIILSCSSDKSLFLGEIE
ncbi:hypothetical protein ACOME3_002008 [Neoechinorhynchus agilis]